MLPATVGLWVIGKEILALLFNYGNFRLEGSLAPTYWALVAYAIGLPAFAGIKVAANAYYSLQDTRTPVKIGFFTVLVNIILALLLMFNLRHVGLALASALSATVNFLLLIRGLRRRLVIREGRSLMRGFMQLFGVSLIMGLAIGLWVEGLDWFLEGRLFSIMAVATSIPLGAGVYFYLVTRLIPEEGRELRDILLRIRARFQSINKLN